MPANEQGLADHISIWGRRRIILRGGNRGVVAGVVDECRVSYGDLRSGCFGGLWGFEERLFRWFASRRRLREFGVLIRHVGLPKCGRSNKL